MKYSRFTFLLVMLLLISCSQAANKKTTVIVKDTVIVNEPPKTPYVERKDINGLIVLIPSFSKVDLRCATMPKVSEKDVILLAAGSYTAAPLGTPFKHTKIAGDHVSQGVKYKGYTCSRNTGAFVYYSGQWKFLYMDYADELDIAANNNGAAFGQEMIIHNGEIMPTGRKDGSKHTFRALSELNGKLCIIESQRDVRFIEFKHMLQDLGVTEALYLDMGPGWNYAWYRTDDETIVELHPKVHEHCTNWITFYR